MKLVKYIDYSPGNISIVGQRMSGKTYFAKKLVQSLIDANNWTDADIKVHANDDWPEYNSTNPKLIIYDDAFCSKDKIPETNAMVIYIGQEKVNYPFTHFVTIGPNGDNLYGVLHRKGELFCIE